MVLTSRTSIRYRHAVAQNCDNVPTFLELSTQENALFRVLLAYLVSVCTNTELVVSDAGPEQSKENLMLCTKDVFGCTTSCLPAIGSVRADVEVTRWILRSLQGCSPVPVWCW